MNIKDFESELKEIDKDLAIRPNSLVLNQKVVDMFPDVAKMAAVTYKGAVVCSIPDKEIFDEPRADYGVDLRNDGRFKAHRTRPEALKIVKDTLINLQDKNERDAFFGTGEYSDANLQRIEPKVPELVEEVKVEAKEIKGDGRIKLNEGS